MRKVRFLIKKLALAFHTGWEYLPGEEELGSVLTDCFLEMLSDNRERFTRIWAKQKQQFLQILPKEGKKRRLLKSAISVTATEEWNGKWLPCDTRMYLISDEGSLIWFHTMEDIRLTAASLRYVVYREGLYAWMSQNTKKGGAVPLLGRQGQAVESPVFRWFFSNLCNGLSECRFLLGGLSEIPMDIILSDGNHSYPMKQEQTKEGLWLSAVTPEFAENLKETEYEIRMEALPWEEKAAALEEELLTVFAEGIALQEKEWEREHPICIAEEKREDSAGQVQPFGKTMEENACCYFACDRILARDCGSVTLEYRENVLIEENLPPENYEKQYKKVYRKYPWMKEAYQVFEKSVQETVWEYFDGSGWRMLAQSRGWNTCCEKESGIKRKFTWKLPTDRRACTIDGETHFYLRLRLLTAKQGNGIYYRSYIPVLEQICLSAPARRHTSARQLLPDIPKSKKTVYLGFDSPISCESQWFLQYQGMDENGENVQLRASLSFSEDQMKGEKVRFGKRAFWVEAEELPQDGKCQKPLKEASIKLPPNCVEIREEAGAEFEELKDKTEGVHLFVNMGKSGVLDARTVIPFIYEGTGADFDKEGQKEEEMGRFGRLVTYADVETWTAGHWPSLGEVECSWEEEKGELTLLCHGSKEPSEEQKKAICEALEKALQEKGSLWLCGCSVRLAFQVTTDSPDKDLRGRIPEERKQTQEVIRLDDNSYEKIYGKALKRLTNQAPHWTHRELSDPGITLLEMWSILSDMQSFYMDQTQESHYRKYRKLLGIPPEEGNYADTKVFFDKVEESIYLPEGTRIMAGEMCFETAEAVWLTSNHLKAFYLPEKDLEQRNRIHVMNMPRKTSFPLAQGKQLFSFELEKPMAEEEALRLFVLLDEKNKRNPAPEGYYMAQLAWEYWTEEGYRKAQVLRDDTRGLLYSGEITLKMDKPMKKTENGGYGIRCRIQKGSYDIWPVLYRISLNVVTALQKKTLCREEHFSLLEQEEKISMRSYLAQTGKLRVYAEREEGLWEDITSFCEIDPPITAERRERNIQLDGQALGKLSAQGTSRLKVISRAPDFLKEQEEVDITGVSTQAIPVLWDHLKRDQVKIMLEQGTESGLYREYQQVEPEEECTYGWHWQEERNTIELGDGRHGVIPKPAQDGFRFRQLVLWEGKKGNVAIGRIRKFEQEALFPGIICRNFMAGQGGRDRKSPSQQFSEIFASCQDGWREKRIVTQEDVRNLAMKTPGLVLKDVRAQWKENAVIVTIFPKEKLTQKYCQEKYISEVQKHLEAYRLAGCQIRVRLEKEADGV